MRLTRSWKFSLCLLPRRALCAVRTACFCGLTQYLLGGKAG